MDRPWDKVQTVEIPNSVFAEISEEESLGSTIVAKAKRSPFVVAGIASFITVCGIGAYRWRTSKLSPTLFFTQLRVAAQGAAVGCLTVGMTYHMLQDFVWKDKGEKDKK